MWTDFLTPVRWLVRGILLALIVLLGTIPTVLCINRIGARIPAGRRQLDEFMLNWWTGSVCRIFGVRVQPRGVVARAPALVVANHISWLDILVLHSVAAMGFVSKAEIAGWPVIGFLARVAGTVFHQRGSHASANRIGEAMAASLAQGRRVAIFPEGGIVPGDGVKLFHARLFRAAVDASCPVQPVMIRYRRGTQVDPGMTFLGGEGFIVNFMRLLGRRGCTCDLHFGEPIDSAGQQRKDLANQAWLFVSTRYGSLA